MVRENSLGQMVWYTRYDVAERERERERETEYGSASVGLYMCVRNKLHFSIHRET